MSTLFISHSSKDGEIADELAQRLTEPPINHHSIFLDFDPEMGIVAGQSWEQTLYRKLRSCSAVVALITDNYLLSQWCFAEIALARMEGKHIIAIQAEPLSESAKMPSILTEKQFIDMRQDPETGFQRLCNGLEELDLLGRGGDWDPRDSPYLGLRSYSEKHADVFFGRGAETRAGLEMLDRGAPDFVMVLGSSGSGKSSLVRAGIVPRVRRDPDRFLVAEPFRPERDPIAALSESLASAYRRYAPDEAAREGSRDHIRDRLEAELVRIRRDDEAAEGRVADELETPAHDRLHNLLAELEDLRSSPPEGSGPHVVKFLDWSLEDLRRICGVETVHPHGARAARPSTALIEIVDHLRHAAGHPDARLLLIIDQFEELLGYDDPESRTQRFLTLIRESLEIENSSIMLLGTMRSDFLGLFQSNAALRDIDFDSLSVGPMSVDAMRRVIDEPAKLGALQLEMGLADRLLEDTETSDALPLLSFTLWRLWEDRQDSKLSVAQYEALGGLQGAIAREAETVLDSARTQGQENELRDAFLLMARITDDGGYARQPVSWDREELKKVRPILESFEQRRLLVTRQEEGADSATLEVAHEALFRSWPPLKHWLDDHRAELMLRQQLKRDAQAWDIGGRPAADLWRGGRLQQAAILIRGQNVDDSGTEVEAQFVGVGVRRQRIRQLAIAGFAAIFVIGLSVGLFFTNRARSEANTAKGEAETQAAAAELARSEAETQAAAADFARSEAQTLAVTANAVALASSSERLLERDPELAGLLAREAGAVKATPETARARYRVASSPFRRTLTNSGSITAEIYNNDRTLVVTAGTDGAVVWDLDGTSIVQLAGPDDGVYSASFSSDGTRIVTAGDGAVVWELDGGRVATLSNPEDGVYSAAFSLDGSRIVTTGFDGAVVWDLDGSRVATLPDSNGGIYSAAFSPDGGRIVTTGEDGAVVWELDGGRVATLSNPEDGVYSAAFSPDGTRILTTGSDGAFVWDLRGNVEAILANPEDGVFSAAFGPDGTRVVTAGVDGAFVWGLDGQLLATLPNPEGFMYSAVFSRDGNEILTAGEGGSRGGVVRWDLVGNVLGTVSQRTAFFADYSHDMNWIVVADIDGASVWEADGTQAALASFDDQVAFTDDGMRILGFDEEGVSLFDGDNNRVASLPTDDAFFAASGSAVLGFLDELVVWDLDGMRLTSPSFGQPPLDLNQDGTRLAIAQFNELDFGFEVVVWESEGNEIASFPAGEVTSVRFDSQGTRVLTTGKQGAVVWSINGEKPLTLNTDDAAWAEFSHDGTRIVTAGRFGVVVWDAAGKEILSLPTGRATSASFNGDGTRIVTGGGGGDVVLWAIEGDEANELATHKGSEDPVVGFTGDGSQIYSIGFDGTVVWRVLDDLAIDAELTRRIGNRLFTRSECDRFRIDPCPGS